MDYKIKDISDDELIKHYKYNVHTLIKYDLTAPIRMLYTTCICHNLLSIRNHVSKFENEIKSRKLKVPIIRLLKYPIRIITITTCLSIFMVCLIIYWKYMCKI